MVACGTFKKANNPYKNHLWGRGDKFGKLTIEAGPFYRNNGAYYLCRCKCGRFVYKRTSNLTRGVTTKCGAC